MQKQNEKSAPLVADATNEALLEIYDLYLRTFAAITNDQELPRPLEDINAVDSDAAISIGAADGVFAKKSALGPYLPRSWTEFEGAWNTRRGIAVQLTKRPASAAE